jgi:hypothetical protein
MVTTSSGFGFGFGLFAMIAAIVLYAASLSFLSS